MQDSMSSGFLSILFTAVIPMPKNNWHVEGIQAVICEMEKNQQNGNWPYIILLSLNNLRRTKESTTINTRWRNITKKVILINPSFPPGWNCFTKRSNVAKFPLVSPGPSLLMLRLLYNPSFTILCPSCINVILPCQVFPFRSVPVCYQVPPSHPLQPRNLSSTPVAKH